MRQLFQGRQEVSNTNAVVTYAHIGRITFDGIGDGMDFINRIETCTRMITSDYKKFHMLRVVDAVFYLRLVYTSHPTPGTHSILARI